MKVIRQIWAKVFKNVEWEKLIALRTDELTQKFGLRYEYYRDNEGLFYYQDLRSILKKLNITEE